MDQQSKASHMGKGGDCVKKQGKNIQFGLKSGCPESNQGCLQSQYFRNLVNKKIRHNLTMEIDESVLQKSKIKVLKKNTLLKSWGRIPTEPPVNKSQIGITEYLETLKGADMLLVKNTPKNQKINIINILNKESIKKIDKIEKKVSKGVRRVANTNIFGDVFAKMSQLGINETLDRILSIYDSLRLFQITQLQLSTMVRSCCLSNEVLEDIFFTEKEDKTGYCTRRMIEIDRHSLIIKIKNTYLEKEESLDMFSRIIAGFRDRLQQYVATRIFPRIKYTERLMNLTSTREDYPEEFLKVINKKKSRKKLYYSNNVDQIEDIERRYGHCAQITRFQRQFYSVLRETDSHIHHKQDLCELDF